MKLLTSLLLFLMSFSLLAQEGTTLEEYRYLSKGFLYQKELGLDIHKNGYTVKNIFTTSNNAELIGLFKDGQKNTKALLVVIDELGQTPIYICIPNSQSEERVLSLYNLDIQRLINVETRKLYDDAIQEFLFSAINNSSEMMESSASTEMLSSAASTPSSSQVSPAEDILVAKGGTEAVMLNNESKVPAESVVEVPAETVVEEPAPKKFTQAQATVSGDVRSRDIVVAPNVQTESLETGTISVKVCVDMDGYVTSAKFTQRGSTTFDKELKKLAVDSASKYRFGKSDRREECGIIKFQF